MSDAELLEPVSTPETPAPEPEPTPEAVTPETPQGEDADLDKIIAEQAIDIPGDTDKLVPLAAVENARAKLKETRAKLAAAEEGSAKATALEGQIQQLQQQLAQLAPMAQAYQAALQAQHTETPAGPSAEEQAELEEIARDNDYYKTDGSLDLDRAKRAQARIYKAAEKIAGAAVAPLQQQSAETASQTLLRSAKLTRLQDGSYPAPEVVDYVWSQLDRSVTGTKAGAQQAFAVAVGYAQMLGKMQKGTAQPTAKEPVPPPILTEKAGGRIQTGPTLSDDDKRHARQMGITDKEYAEELAKMPAGWGKR